MQQHCTCTIAATVVLEVLQPSPLKKSHPNITKEERSSENKERSLNHFFGYNSTKVVLIIFVTLTFCMIKF
jgi:hypothetical protein